MTSNRVWETMAIDSAAAFFNLKPTALEQWRWNGKGPLLSKLGRCVRYRRADLVFLNDRLPRFETEKGITP